MVGRKLSRPEVCQIAPQDATPLKEQLHHQEETTATPKGGGGGKDLAAGCSFLFTFARTAQSAVGAVLGTAWYAASFDGHVECGGAASSASF